MYGIILMKNDFFGFLKVKWLQYKVRWASVQAIDVMSNFLRI